MNTGPMTPTKAQLNPDRSPGSQINWWTRLKAHITSGQGRRKLFTVGVEVVGWGEVESYVSFTWKFFKMQTSICFPSQQKLDSANKNYCYNELLLLLVIVFAVTLM